ncbi:MAG: glutamate synthase [Alphaproteobacteria bacterium]
MAAVTKAGPCERIDCARLTTTEINTTLRRLAHEGVAAIELLNPNGRHNLGVCVTDPVRLVYRGDVGYYAVSICDHVSATIHGDAGWGVAENLMNGEVVVEGNASSAAATSIRSGRVIVKGDAGPRSAIGMKGGEVVIGGNAGYMTGFMMQTGRLIVCGSTARAFADSIYDGAVFVGGRIEEQGNGLKQVDPAPGELDDIRALLDRHGMPAPKGFRKLVSDGSLRTFKKEAFEVWKEIL